MIIIATTDYRGSLKATDTARRLNPNIHIEVRTKYIKMLMNYMKQEQMK